MICPKCEYEYIDGHTICADCGENLIPVDDFKGNLVHHGDWFIIKTVSEMYEAEMLKANLSGADIETLILGQKDSSYPAVGGLAVIKVLIKKKDAEAAKEILNDIYK